MPTEESLRGVWDFFVSDALQIDCGNDKSMFWDKNLDNTKVKQSSRFAAYRFDQNHSHLVANRLLVLILVFNSRHLSQSAL